jgi:glucose-1-phosphate thymidylyltransferase
MHAIIPVAGAGTKLRPHTHTLPKPLIPVAGKPILGYIVESLAEAGVQDFTFVIGYLGSKIRAYIEETFKDRIRYTFIRQENRMGIGHALHLCQANVPEGQPLLIALGDAIIDADLQELLARPENLVCVQRVDDPRKFGVAQLNDEGQVTELVEKPAIPKSNLALVGLYRLQDSRPLFHAIDYLLEQQQTTLGEFQLTDALQYMVSQGVVIKTFPVKRWFDCGDKDALLETNRILLDRQVDAPLPAFPGSIVVPPVSIAPNCVIEHSIIGPYVAIAENSVIRNSILEDTILGAYTTLDSIILRRSVVGNDSTLKGRSQAVSIGDNTEIDFNS